MVTSFETEYDFRLFYKSLKDLSRELGHVLDPEYIMQDACLASFNAAKMIFPLAIVLMCYFHVMQNVSIKFCLFN
jgi:hypothetical protein